MVVLGLAHAWFLRAQILRGIGVLSSIFTTYLVKGGATGNAHDAMNAIFRSFASSATRSRIRPARRSTR